MGKSRFTTFIPYPFSRLSSLAWPIAIVTDARASFTLSSWLSRSPSYHSGLRIYAKKRTRDRLLAFLSSPNRNSEEARGIGAGSVCPVIAIERANEYATAWIVLLLKWRSNLYGSGRPRPARSLGTLQVKKDEFLRRTKWRSELSQRVVY